MNKLLQGWPFPRCAVHRGILELHLTGPTIAIVALLSLGRIRDKVLFAVALGESFNPQKCSCSRNTNQTSEQADMVSSFVPPLEYAPPSTSWSQVLRMETCCLLRGLCWEASFHAVNFHISKRTLEDVCLPTLQSTEVLSK